jgi:hypothetical protein
MQIDCERIKSMYEQLWQLNDYVNMMNLYMMMTQMRSVQETVNGG